MERPLPPGWWYDVLKSKFELEVDTPEVSYTPIIVDPQTRIQFRLIMVPKGQNFRGLNHGIFLDTSISVEAWKSNTSGLEAFVNTITLTLLEGNTKPKIIAEVPPEVAKRLPPNAVVDLGSAAQVLPKALNDHGGLLFEILPVSISEYTNQAS